MADWFLVWSNEHGAWWRANGHGYTSVIEDAGRYDRAEAERIAHDASVGGQLKVLRENWLAEQIEVLPEVVVLAPESLPPDGVTAPL